MKAVKWLVAKLQGNETASFCRENEWSRSYKEINQPPNLPWNFITHGILDPSVLPEDVPLYEDRDAPKNADPTTTPQKRRSNDDGSNAPSSAL